MRKIRFFIIFFLTSFFFFFFFLPIVKADELEEIAQQIAEFEKAKRMSEEATRPLEAELLRLETKLDNIQAGIKQAEANLVKLEKNIKKREKDFEVQYAILAQRVEGYYKRLRQPSGFLMLFSSQTASGLTKDLSYRQSVTDEDKKIISQISKELLQLERDKKKLEVDKQRLAVLKKKTDEQAEFFRKEIKGAKEYQAQLSGKIANLVARQKELLAQKTGTFQTTVGEVPLSDDPNSRPDFDPGFRPAFAAFSFGAPHFRGMSQYGAFGRAKNGQSYEQILKAYYGDIRLETVDTNLNIPTVVGNLPFEDNYLKGIAEMPTKWADEGGFEALKAQAVAARSYALAYTGWRMGDRSCQKPICITEACQVYNSSKAGNPGRWGEAVEASKGKIMVSNSGNEVVNAWYASTSGGYQESYSSLDHSTPGFWDTECGNQGCWTAQAWEKKADSPWFYKGWYKSRSGTSCGRSHPWLTKEEMADLVNAAVVYDHNKDNQEVVSHIWQEDNCYQSEADIWSKDKMRQEAAKNGAGVSTVSDVSVSYSNAGVTAKVIFQTDKGKIEIGGTSFYKAFNRRAPGAVHLKSGLFNIEKK